MACKPKEPAKIALEPAPVAQLPAVIEAKPVLTRLADMAKAINTAFAEIDVTNAVLTDKRLTAGQMLKEARDRIAAQKPKEYTFEAWCRTNINRSQSDIYACIALASSDDPAASRKAEQANTRARQATHRARKSVTSQTPATPLPSAYAPAPPMPPPIEAITVEWASVKISPAMYIKALKDLAVAVRDNGNLTQLSSEQFPEDETSYFRKSLANMIAAAHTFLARVGE